MKDVARLGGACRATAKAIQIEADDCIVEALCWKSERRRKDQKTGEDCAIVRVWSDWQACRRWSRSCPRVRPADGGISRFTSVKKAVSYCGLCGAEKSSGGKTKRPSILKQGTILSNHVDRVSKLAPRWDAAPRGPSGVWPTSGQSHSFPGADLCHAGVSMRDPEIIETELMEISAIADDTVKFERIVAWCASHPDEVSFALHHFMGRPDKHPTKAS
jgi:hypothetical protein